MANGRWKGMTPQGKSSQLLFLPFKARWVYEANAPDGHGPGGWGLKGGLSPH